MDGRTEGGATHSQLVSDVAGTKREKSAHLLQHVPLPQSHQPAMEVHQLFRVGLRSSTD